MIKLYRACIREMTDAEYENILSRLPENIRQRIERKKKASDRRLSAAGYSLALGAADELLGEKSHEVVFADSGKPYFKDLSLFFSISHSGDRVIVAVSDREVGADIEKRREPPRGVAERFFTERERACDFFEIWTKKEALGKCKGGLPHVLSHDVTELPFYTEDDGEYVIAVYEE